jgi:hypothetical protein
MSVFALYAAKAPEFLKIFPVFAKKQKKAAVFVDKTR